MNEKRDIQSSVAPPYQNTFKSDGHLQLKRSYAIGIEKEGSKKFIVKKGANNYLSKNDKYSNEITWTMMKDNTLQLSKLNVTTPLKK